MYLTSSATPASSTMPLRRKPRRESMLFSLNHDLGPSAGNVRIRVDRCPTTYFSGRCSYLDGQGRDRRGGGRRVLQSHRTGGDLVSGGQTAEGVVGPASGVPR